MVSKEEIKIAITAVNEASKTLQQIEKDFKKLGDGASRASKSIQRSSKDIKKSLDDVQKIGVGMTAAITAPLALMGAQMVKSAGNMEQLKIAFDTMLGSAEKGSELLKKVSDFAVATPFDLPQVAQGARQLLAYGYTIDEIIPSLRMLGDVSAGVGAPITDIVYLMGTLRAQGRAYMIDIRQFANRGIPIYDELAKVLGVAKTEVRELVSEGKVGFKEVQVAFKNMTKEGGLYSGLMERQSKSLQGIMSNLRDQFVRVSMAFLGLSTNAENFGEVIEDGVFDKLKDAAFSALDAVNEFVDWFSALPQPIKTATVNVIAFLAVLGPLLVAFTAIAKVMMGVGATLTSIGTAFSSSTLGAILFSSGIAVLVAKLALVVGALYLAKKATDAFIDGFTGTNREEIDAHNKKLSDMAKTREEAYEKEMSNFEMQKQLMLAEFNLHEGIMTEAQKQGYKDRLKEVEDGERKIEIASLKAKSKRVQNQIAYAETVKGIYDIQNDKILAGAELFWKENLNQVKVGGKAYLLGFGSLLDALGRAVAKTTKNLAKDLQGLFTSIGSGLSALWKSTTAKTDEEWAEVDSLLANAFKKDVGDPGAYIFIDTFVEEYEKNISAASDEMDRAGEDFKTKYKQQQFDLAKEIDKVNKKFAKDVESSNDLIEQKFKNLAGAPGGDKGKSADDKVKKLGESLKELGVFAIKAGDKIVATFDDAKEGLKKLSEELDKVNESFKEQQYAIEFLGYKIGQALGKDVIKPESILSPFEQLNEEIKEIEKGIDKIIKKYQEFIEKASDGLEEYADKVKELNAEFDKERTSAIEEASEETAKKYYDVLTKIKDLKEEIRTSDEDAKGEMRVELRQLEAEFNALRKINDATKDYASALAEVNEKIAGAGNEAQKKVLEEERLVLLGKQKLYVEEQLVLEQSMADARAEANLSETDFIAYKLGQELEAIEAKRNAELKAINDLKTVQENIVAGTVDMIDIERLRAEGYTEESIALAEQAQAEKLLYETSLNEKQSKLREFEATSKEIYKSITDEFKIQQDLLVSYTELSTNKMIAKYQELESAAKSAASAQSKVGGSSLVEGKKSGGFVSGFSLGGFTGAGNENAVAGIVHRGEWVAPKWMVQSLRPLFAQLEEARAGGGSAGANTTNNITMNNSLSEQVDFNQVLNDLLFGLGSV